MKSGREKLSNTAQSWKNTYWAITKPRIWSSCTWPNTPLWSVRCAWEAPKWAESPGQLWRSSRPAGGKSSRSPFSPLRGEEAVMEVNPLLYWSGVLLLLRRSVVSKSWQPHRLQHSRLPCPSLSPGVCSNSCLLDHWCYLTSHPLPDSCSFAFNLSQQQGLFQYSGSQSIGAYLRSKST